MDEIELVKRCQLGDIEAFGMLIEKYTNKAVRTAYLATGQKDLAEDIAQEAFMQCFKTIKNLKNIEYFKTWFYRILIRTSWRMATKARQHSQNVFTDINNLEDTLPDTSNILEEVEKKQRYKAIYAAINEMDKIFREVIILYYFNEFSIKEIANILSCRDGTVKSRLHKARKLLADIFTDKELNNSSNEFQLRKESNFNGRTRIV